MKPTSRGLLALALVAAFACNVTPVGAATKTTKKPTKATKASTKTTAKATPTTSVATTAAPATTVPAASSTAAWDAVVTNAKKEGKVTLYSVMVPGVNDRISAAWKKAYPDIQLEIVRVLGELDAKLEAERTTGAAGADVAAHVNYPYASKGQAAGYWVKFQGPNLTGKPFAGSQWIQDSSIVTPVLTSIVLTYNSNFVRGGIKDYRDLLNRDFAGGQIGLPDPGSAAVADFYAWLEDKYGADFLTKLAAQKPVIYSSAVPLEQGLIAGEISIGAYATSVGTIASIKAGAPLKYVVPTDAWGSPVWTYIPKWSKHPNAAQVLVNWMASPEGQTVLGEEQYSPTDVKGSIGPIAGMTPINVKRTNTDGWYATYYDRWKKTFGR